MVFDALGDKTNPAIVMLNGSFCTCKGLMPMAERFAQNYYVILPTYDGHVEGSGPFTDRRDEAVKVLHYLKEQSITQIALIQGLSMGAEIALDLVDEILKDQSLEVKHALFDGGPFFHFPGLLRIVLRSKFLSLVHSLQKGTPEEAVSSFLSGRTAQWMLKGDCLAYAPMLMDMCHAARAMTDDSVKRESDACYTFDFPALPKDYQKRFIFSYSSNEPARRSQSKMMACYPHALFEDAGALGHCGFLVRKPDDYEKYLRKILAMS